MRKVTILVFMMAMMFLWAGTAYADDITDDLTAVGIRPIQAQSGEKTITRAEFVYLAAQLMNMNELKPIATRFQDVDETNLYSGYIEFMANANMISGDGTGVFLPDSPVNIHAAYKILCNVLGYTVSDDYVKVAAGLGLHRGVNVSQDGYLTYQDANKMIHNTLLAETIRPNIVYANGSQRTDGTKSTLLADRFGISVYTGVITKVNQQEYSVSFIVDKNKYNSNPRMLGSGTELTLSAKTNININHFEYAPVVVWVNDKDEMVNITLQKNVQIMYRTIDSVNDDSDEDASYSIRFMKSITLLDDENEYEIANGAKLKYNNEETISAVKLNGKLAKLVVSEDQILYIESWDFAEGGIITSVDGEEIVYTKGDKKSLKVKEIPSYEKVLVFIDGRSTDIKELKTNSVFCFYEKNDCLVIAASEKVIVDVFKSIGEDNIEIGNTFYKMKKLYYSLDGSTYKTNNEYTALFDTTVVAYVSPAGNVDYIAPYKNQVMQPEIYGIVSGIETVLLQPNEAKIELWVLGDKAEKQMFTITENTKYEGVLFSDLEQNAKKYDGKGIYLFEIGTNNRIRKISKASQLYGFEGTTAISSSFVDSVAMVYVGGKSLYFDNVLLTAIYVNNGVFTVKQVPWSLLQGRFCGNETKITFFGEDKKSTPSIVLLTGDLGNIGSKVRKYGVITKKSEMIDKDGNKGYAVTVMSGENSTKYMVTAELGKTLPSYAFITFYDELLFSESEIAITATPIDLTKVTEDWTTSTVATGFKKGVVESIDKYMIHLTDGSAYCMHPNQNFFMQVSDDTNPNLRFEGIDVSEINSGDMVFINVQTDGIRGVIAVK